MFRLPRAGGEGPVYCCQADGMIGLGVGARSYTQTLHYSDDWAVGSAGIREIVGAWIERSDAQLRVARYGIELSADEQRRRWLIQSLLQQQGLALHEYAARFGADVFADFSAELEQLRVHGLLELTQDHLRPTTIGLEWADAIAPWLYSEPVRAASREFELR
jgi:oxygen-independent coproporphyrinogen-3 oxidase